MAAMMIGSSVSGLAGARPLKVSAARRASRSAAPLRVTAVTGVSVSAVKAPAAATRRGALQVPRAIAVPYGYEATGMTYNDTGKWRENFDLAAWAAEVRAVEKELKASVGEDDVKHLNKILTWANCFYYGGLAVLFATPFVTSALGIVGSVAWGVNPIAAFMMSTAICARWTMVGHHVCHGGYNTAQSENGVVTGRFHRRTFARGVARRLTDWMDWMMPEAWDVEHNHLHHYQLGEKADPDLLERNMEPLRNDKNMPMAMKYGQVIGLALIWKWFYYAPNTMKELYAKKAREAEKAGEVGAENPYRTGELPSTVITVIADAFQGKFGALITTAKCFAPYATTQFAALPAIGWAVGGPSMALGVLLTSILADVMTNVHSFIIIATNHVGDDIYRFETEAKPRSDDFYLRACIGSANFKTGGDVNDFFHGWLNYQIEHHMFPDISMKAYQKAQPKIEAICKKHGVPYVQQSVWKRLDQLSGVMVGKKSMLVWERGD
mmetsp:Transcript_14978/g.36224  ORF Transcript_14978/g.36224 Transcript_14978/m.36224 type:complete len:494 (+) Transcript_14978:130-1611(+)|eukprot:CAMPEP_0197574366 /NCGR_PEP_ID=MMETSP1326-20131121/95_1 /TAXON_ID=1155430 /ORGANISM="Genus nov. species nov., Strain RCC2288" /LENGTH=493 /DNA_ID=CAMNT_0043136923 /DNA_START=81 /DNA_END=1562 /DNA_ORIENTATION=-